MTIDPRVGLWLSIIAAVVSALVAGGAEFTDIFGAQNAKMIIGILGIINTIINAINAILHAIPSQRGPVGAAQFPLGPKP
jgi:phage-related protein